MITESVALQLKSKHDSSGFDAFSKRLKGVRKEVKNAPIRVPVVLDMSRIDRDLERVRGRIAGRLAKFGKIPVTISGDARSKAADNIKQQAAAQASLNREQDRTNNLLKTQTTLTAKATRISTTRETGIGKKQTVIQKIKEKNELPEGVEKVTQVDDPTIRLREQRKAADEERKRINNNENRRANDLNSQAQSINKAATAESNRIKKQLRGAKAAEELAKVEIMRAKALDKVAASLRKVEAAADGRGDFKTRNFARGVALTTESGSKQASRQSDIIKENYRKDAARGIRTLRKELDALIRTQKEELKILDQEERRAKKAKFFRKKKLRDINEQRQEILNRSASSIDNVKTKAKGLGYTAVSDRATRSAEDARSRGRISLRKFNSDLRDGGHALSFHSSNMLRNAATFAQWTAAATVVLSITQALGSGISQMIKVDRQFATLRAVFRGTNDEAQKLKISTLELAQANGRSSEEAIDSAVRFSRLGLTRVQTLRLVETSLQAANVAEISAAQSAEYLSSIYAAFKLNISDLPALLNRINAISNRYNVTNKDILEGLSRVSGVAKQAGLSLPNLEGIIASATAATGRSGSEIGNALKTIITRIRRPDTVKKLKEAFDIDLLDGGGQFKSLDTIIDQLAGAYASLTKTQQAYFLDLVGGAKQANRLQIILDNYGKSLDLQIQSLLDSNSANRENEKILASVESRLQSVKDAWANAFVAMGDSGALLFMRTLIQNTEDLIANLTTAQNAMSELIPVTSRTTRDTVKAANVSGQIGPDFLRFSDSTPGDLTRIRDTIKEIVRRQESGQDLQLGKSKLNPLDYESTTLAPDQVDAAENLINRISDDGFLTQDAILSELKRRLTDLESFIARSTSEANRDGLAFSLGYADSDVNQQRQRVQAAVKTAQRANQLADLSSSTNLTDQELGKQLVSIVDTLKSFDESFGTDLASSAEEISEAMAHGERDSEKIYQTFKNIAKEADKVKLSESEKFNSDQKSNIEKLQKERAKLEFARDKIRDSRNSDQSPDQQQLNIKELSLISDALKEIDDTISSINNGINVDQSDAIGDLIQARISHLQSLIKLQGEALGAAVSGLGGSDPIAAAAFSNFDKETAAKFQKKALQGQLKTVESQPITGTPEEQKRQTDAVVALKNAIAALRGEEEQLAAERAANTTASLFTAAIQNGQRAAGILIARNSFGESDADKQINALRFIRKNANSFGRGNNIGGAAARQSLADEGIRRVYDLEQRRAELQVRMIDLKKEETRAIREQQQELSRELALAERSDQLRAAALAKFQKTNGSIGLDEFSFLSSETRQTASRFNPDFAEGLNPLRSGLQQERQQIQQDIQNITGFLAEMGGTQQAIKEFRDTIIATREQIDPTRFFSPRNANTTKLTQDQQSPVQLNLSPTFQIEFGRQFTQAVNILGDRLRAEFGEQLTQMRQTVLGTQENPATTASGI